jgi:hypothetical protein
MARLDDLADAGAGTRSPDCTRPALLTPAGAHWNGSSASHSARHRNEPFVSGGLAASTSSKSLERDGGRLSRIWRLCTGAA